MYLYEIVNKISGTKYYGITVNPKQRWYSHKQMRHKTPLYSAMRSYGLDNFELNILAEGPEEHIAQMEIDLIKSDPDCYNLHLGGSIGFDVRFKGEQAVQEWKAKLSLARAGRKPALGMKHSKEVKKLCAEYSKLRWDKEGRYPDDVLEYSFIDAKEKYGISKTHYYRLKRQRASDSL